MSNISFQSFYKGKIERLIWKPTIDDLNISAEEIQYLDLKT